ncbi:hypothetical protein PF001_g26458 [Phytophthora fragariae]|uniref:Secreted protein n=1 Tax=Phytophthora fragariae TaxID=53985 RepID=A0A6A3HV75_9STRA|nr:hypothetical protein PF003_g33251 [Phytophthora fragariae]KAE8922049.1 hypothetical protein PF009_g27680 [Phytophthora fragariae]KAE8971658.1 hypothetical protein PF011_g25954 [Phytophthora fragariae]KAE9177073.1 hypothetical protein PF004_g25881 [Phytophthora fragariae]KAE9267708.1 hypothetical protein PF008_g31295 [Phytophthora fragariae]
MVVLKLIRFLAALKVLHKIAKSEEDAFDGDQNSMTLHTRVSVLSLKTYSTCRALRRAPRCAPRRGSLHTTCSRST